MKSDLNTEVFFINFTKNLLLDYKVELPIKDFIDISAIMYYMMTELIEIAEENPNDLKNAIKNDSDLNHIVDTINDSDTWKEVVKYYLEYKKIKLNKDNEILVCKYLQSIFINGINFKVDRTNRSYNMYFAQDLHDITYSLLHYLNNLPNKTRVERIKQREEYRSKSSFETYDLYKPANVLIQMIELEMTRWDKNKKLFKIQI